MVSLTGDRILRICLLVTVLIAPVAGHSQASSTLDIVIYGASGKIGGLIVAEALSRGHRVTGVSRNAANLSVDHENFSAVAGDVTDLDSFRTVTAGADAVLIAAGGSFSANHAPELSVQAQAAVTATSAFRDVADAPQVLQIGGATTMFPSFEAVGDMLPFPVEEGTVQHGNMVGHFLALDTYRNSDIDWTVLAPPMQIIGYTFTGITDTSTRGGYRTSTTELLRDAEGNNSIYVADLAAAAVDELENRRFRQHRFTVGY